MGGIRDIILELCSKVYSPNNIEKTKTDALPEFGNDGVEFRISKLEIPRIKEGRGTSFSYEIQKSNQGNYQESKNSWFSDYLAKYKEKIASGYQILQTKTRETYKKVKKKIFNGAPARDYIKNAKIKILDWCFVLPKEGDPKRDIYIALL